MRKKLKELEPYERSYKGGTIVSFPGENYLDLHADIPYLVMFLKLELLQQRPQNDLHVR
jgi:hypothetical protein